MPNFIFTIGHSNHSLPVFLAFLESYTINQLIDIRTIPYSRHNPQFNFDTFPSILRSEKINYRHEKKLGGLRKPRKDSVNTAWNNLSFRGFADYMQTDEFQEGLNSLITIAQNKTCALMCAEAVPWRCHRSLIGDALLVRGFDVYDIFSFTNYKPHVLTPWAHTDGNNIIYPATKKSQD